MLRLSILKEFFVLFLTAPVLVQAAAVQEINPEVIARRVFEESLRVRQIRLNADATRRSITSAEAVFDWSASASFNRSIDRAESFSTIENEEDRYTEWSLGVAKKLPYGTTLGLEFGRLRQDSTLSALSQSFNILADQTKDELQFSLKQELVKNALGIVDRYQVRSAQLAHSSANLEAREQIEAVLAEVLTKYWQAVSAKRRIEESTAAQKRYLDLVNRLGQKRRLGVASKADLYRAEAEYWSQTQSVSESRELFDRLASELKEELNWSPDARLDFSPPEIDLESQPKRVEGIAPERLRTVVAAAENLEQRTWLRRAAKLQSLPELNFLGTLRFTGVEPTSGSSFSDLGNHISYSVGFELTWLIDSSLYRGDEEFAEVQWLEATAELERRMRKVQAESARAWNDLQEAYELAKASGQEVDFRKRVIVDQERSFRQGRIDSSQLITDYNALYLSQARLTERIGAYQIALLRYDALFDRLLPRSDLY